MKRREKRKRRPKSLELAQWMNQKLAEKLGGRIPGGDDVRQNLKILYQDTDTKGRMEAYYAEKTALVLKVLAAGVCIVVFLAVEAVGVQNLTEGHFLPRRKAAYTCELQVGVDGEVKRKMKIRVEPRKLSKEESRALLLQVLEEMDGRILGDNASLEEVRGDLRLMRGIEGTPVAVEWEMDSYLELNLDGSLRRENLKEEGSLVELTAYLSCNGEEEVYRTCVHIFPPVLSVEEKFRHGLSEAIEHFQEQSEEEELQELPGYFEGQKLAWGEEKAMAGVAAAGLLTLLGAVMLYVAKDRELGQKIKEREMQMRRDYTRIVSKLTLLMGAGATIRTAWDLTVQDYEKGREEGREMRYAYEEMAYTCRELQNGMAEAKAYENFGIRCRIPSYLKLSALLEQNLKKGNRGLTELLHAEVEEAFAGRREIARCRGEEASTKLLAPMILMLIVVMILILVPAGISMQT